MLRILDNTRSTEVFEGRAQVDVFNMIVRPNVMNISTMIWLLYASILQQRAQTYKRMRVEPTVFQAEWNMTLNKPICISSPQVPVFGVPLGNSSGLGSTWEFPALVERLKPTGGHNHTKAGIGGSMLQKQQHTTPNSPFTTIGPSKPTKRFGSDPSLWSMSIWDYDHDFTLY